MDNCEQLRFVNNPEPATRRNFTLYPFNPFNLFNPFNPMKRLALLLPILALAALPSLAQDPAR